MFTQCPDCRTVYSLTTEQLQNNILVFCSKCSKEFNALELLNENASALAPQDTVDVIAKPHKNKTKAKRKSRNRQEPKKQQSNGQEGLKPIKELELQGKKPTGLLKEADAEFISKAEAEQKDKPDILTNSWQQAKKKSDIGGKKNNSDEAEIGTTATSVTSERLPWESAKITPNINWTLGLVVGSVLLLGQIIYFESDGWSQNATYRPTLETICRWVGCQLRDYENLDEFTVLNSSFMPNGDTIEFKAVINNQAAFTQRLPNIKLVLLDYNEQVVAQRIFTPKEYVPGTDKNYAIASDATVETSLTIVAPEARIGGHTIELTY